MEHKSRFLTFVLSWVPGLGHLYLGLNRRGLQFMVAAFACIVLTTMMPLVFPFVLAIVWFYALFDALQKAALINRYVALNKSTDTMMDGSSVMTQWDGVVLPLESLQRSGGIGTFWLGGLFIVTGVLILIREVFPQVWRYLVGAHVGTLVLALILIGFGVWLIRLQVKNGETSTRTANHNRSEEREPQ